MIFGIRRWPVLPTIIVLAAVAIMVGLGVWQLGRLEQKEALLARYEEAISDPAPLSAFPWYDPERNLFRRAPLHCDQVIGWNAIAGRNANDQTGYVHVATCIGDGRYSFDSPSGVEVVIGWSPGPDPVDWQGGAVTGIIAPGGERGWRLVADQPQAGLAPNATPDPNSIPNNHLAYAGQWFFFALTALVIYVLALRRRTS